MTRRARPSTSRAKGSPAAAPVAGIEAPPLGHSGRHHPPIGLGLWGLGRWHPDDEERTRTTLLHALERKIPWVDTAEVYGAGRSERLLGEALVREPAAGRSAPFVSTKLSWEHLRPSQVRPSLIGSLHRLGIPKVDLYLVHAPDPHVPLRETMAALETLWKEGRIGAIGVSNFSLEQLEEAAKGLRETELVAHQVQFNLLQREEADSVLPYCREHQIALEAYSPLAQGLLAGRFLKGKAPATKDGRGRFGIFSGEEFPEYQKRAVALTALAESSGVPLPAIALHALARAGAAPVFGASRPEQVDAALAAWDERVDDGLLDKAEAIGRGTDPSS